MTDNHARVPKLIVERNADGSFTLKREGGGPFFSLYPQEIEDFKAGKYDLTQKGRVKKEEPAPG